MSQLLLLLVRGYRLAISPLFPPRCRFLPSCSEYALQALERHGALAGAWLALRRLVRCHPFNRGGIDEVPEQLRRLATETGPGSSRLRGRWGRFACSCRRPPSLAERTTATSSSRRSANQ